MMIFDPLSQAKSVVAASGYYEATIKGLLVGIGAAMYYVFPGEQLRSAAIAAFILILLDTVTGIAAAVAKGQPRSSKRFARVVTKLLGYMSVCVAAAIVEKTIMRGAGLPITLAALWLIIATEGLSIIENVEAISGGRFRWLRAILGKVVQADREQARAEREND